AIQNRDPDQAWALLATPQAAGVVGPRGPVPTQDEFRQQVLNQSRPSNHRLRLIGSTLSEDTAKVDIELSFASSRPALFGGASTPQTRTFELKKQDSSWRITTAPSVFDLA